MRDVFLSYAHEDRERAGWLAGALESAGYSVWWDLQIAPGRTFSQVIEEALQETQCVVVLWTKASVRNEWVEIEAGKARQRGILVPVLLDDVAAEIPLEFSRLHAANLTRWRPGVKSPEWEVFVEAVGEHTHRKAKKPVPAPPPERPDAVKSARRFLLLACGAYAAALAGEFLVAQYFFELRRIGNAYQLYGRTLNSGLFFVGLLWLGVAVTGLIAAARAKLFSIKGASLLGRFLAPLSLAIYLYSLLIESQRYSDGPSFPFPYYGVLANAMGYHGLLLLIVIGTTVYIAARRPA